MNLKNKINDFFKFNNFLDIVLLKNPINFETIFIKKGG